MIYRYQEQGKTKIREAEFGDDAKTTGSSLGFDANALYLWSLMQLQPAGIPVRRRAENDFKPETQNGFRSYEWLMWYSHVTGAAIRHQYNNTEKRIGSRQVPVDGYIAESRTILQFDGCFYHGCSCVKEPKPDAEERRRNTIENTQYLESEGYTVIRMKECQWLELRKRRDIRLFLNGKNQ